jgi:hypothetical protein
MPPNGKTIFETFFGNFLNSRLDRIRLRIRAKYRYLFTDPADPDPEH